MNLRKIPRSCQRAHLYRKEWGNFCGARCKYGRGYPKHSREHLRIFRTISLPNNKRAALDNMKKKETNPPSDRPEDIEMIAKSIRSYMDNVLEGILDCAQKISAEEGRNDRLHRARMNKLRDEFEASVDQYARSKSELKSLRQTGQLTARQRDRLELVRRFTR